MGVAAGGDGQDGEPKLTGGWQNAKPPHWCRVGAARHGERRWEGSERRGEESGEECGGDWEKERWREKEEGSYGISRCLDVSCAD